MNAYYRNKRTGEIKDVVQDSPEMYALQQEKDPYDPAQPVWEQTSHAHAQAVKVRAGTEALRPEDLGKDHEDALRNAGTVLSAEGVGPEVDPHLALTPGEIESGLTPDQKREDLAAQFDQQGLGKIAGTYSDAAETIRDEEFEKPEPVPTRGQTSRAGGSDERDGAPRVTAPADEEAGSGSGQSGGGLSSSQGLSGAPAVTTPASGGEPEQE